MKKVKVLASVLVASFLMVGCAKYDVVPPELTVLSSVSNDGYVCQGSCTNEWAKTQVWINRHSMMKTQLANDTIIETYNPSGNAMGFSAAKEPIGNNSSRIKLNTSNYNSNTAKTALYAEKAFYYYLKTGKDLLSPKPNGMFFSIMIK